jgi:CRP/FNR family transcriptional regulator, cyclic AMP receptor protein
VSQEREVRLLSLVDVLEPLSENELRELAARCPDIRLEPGEDFYRQEEHDGGLFLIKEGRVRVYRLNHRGAELTLALHSSGTALSARRLQGLHAQAMERSVLAFMRREDLEYFVSKNPAMAMRLIDLLAERLRTMDARMADVVHKQVPARLASLILQLVETEGMVAPEGLVIPGPYTHEQLGTMIGAKRVAVARAFGRLRRAGAVEVERRRIRVADREALESIAAEER